MALKHPGRRSNRSSQRRHPHPKQAHPRCSPSLVWFGTVGTALVIAIATAFGTGLGQRLISIATNASSSGGPPVKIDTISLERTAGQAGTYVFPNKLMLGPSQLAALNKFNLTDPQYNLWFRDRGGVDPDSSNIKLVVQGNRQHAVEIIGMRAIKSCQRPLSGTIFYSPPAGEENIIGIGFNLDSVSSIAENYSNRLFGDFFAEHTISLSPNEVQALQIVTLTAKHYCKYTLQFTVVDGGSTTAENVTYNGHQFQVTATVNEHGPTYAGPGALSYYRALYVGGVANGATTQGGFKPASPMSYNSG